MDDATIRATALEVASRSGLSPRITLEAARSFYDFLTGREVTIGGHEQVKKAAAKKAPRHPIGRGKLGK